MCLKMKWGTCEAWGREYKLVLLGVKEAPQKIEYLTQGWRIWAGPALWLWYVQSSFPLGMNALGHGIEVLISPLNLSFVNRVHCYSDPSSGSLEIQLPHTPSDSAIFWLQAQALRVFPPWGPGLPVSGEGLIRIQILWCFRDGHWL